MYKQALSAIIHAIPQLLEFEEKVDSLVIVV
jgi:hypothetical protein